MHFIFDLDGTISFNGQPMSSNIRRALTELTDNGHEVIFTSSRPIREMLAIIHQDFHYYTMIGGNGSLIATNGIVVHSQAFSKDQAQEIIQFIEEFDATYLIDGDWDYDYSGPDDHPILQQVDPANVAELVHFDDLPLIVKFSILTSKNHEQFAHKLSEHDVFIDKQANGDVLDIRPKGIQKRSALDSLGVEKDNYVVFSNDANDVSMFEHASHSVMIGHHSVLSTVANEAIPDVENIEQQIIERTMELSAQYAL